ncbi:hypothetical protein AB0I50_48330, partial [Streptomyces prunicolor]
MSTSTAEHSPGRAAAGRIAARARQLTKAYGSGETAVLALEEHGGEGGGVGLLHGVPHGLGESVERLG